MNGTSEFGNVHRRPAPYTRIYTSTKFSLHSYPFSGRHSSLIICDISFLVEPLEILTRLSSHDITIAFSSVLMNSKRARACPSTFYSQCEHSYIKISLVSEYVATLSLPNFYYLSAQTL